MTDQPTTKMPDGCAGCLRGCAVVIGGVFGVFIAAWVLGAVLLVFANPITIIPSTLLVAAALYGWQSGKAENEDNHISGVR